MDTLIGKFTPLKMKNIVCENTARVYTIVIVYFFIANACHGRSHKSEGLQSDESNSLIFEDIHYFITPSLDNEMYTGKI